MPSVREIVSRINAPRVRFSFSSTASQQQQTQEGTQQVIQTINESPSEDNNNNNNNSQATEMTSIASLPDPATEQVNEQSYVQQRRLSAAQSMAQRRTSTTQIMLQESREQEARPEEGRHHKRRSTNLQFPPEQQAELLREAAAAEAANRSDAFEEEKTPDESLASSSTAPLNDSARPPLAPPRSTANSSLAQVVTATSVQQVFPPSTTPPPQGMAQKAEVDENKEEKLSAAISVPAATLESLPYLSREMVSGNPERELLATISIRTMLSQNVDWIQTIISTPNIVPKLVSFLERDDQRRLQFEATWSLTNIASGTSAHTLHVVRAGALAPLIRLLDSPSVEIREQAVWAIGNIAGDSPELRDEVLNHGIVPILTKRLDTELSLPPRKQHPSLMRNAVWTIANMCRGKPPPPFNKVRGVIPVLGRAIETSDPEMQADACWALNYLGDGDHERIQALVDAGVCARLVELMEHPSHTVKTPALRAVGNVVTGDDAQTEHILNLGALSRLRNLLVDPRHTIRGEACWTISNITAGNHTQIQKVMNADIIPRLIECAKDVETYVAKEAVWAITNATSGGTTEQVISLGRQGCIPGLVGALENAEELNNRVVVVALEGISNFLTAGDLRDPSNNEFVQILRDCGGETLLRNDLRHHVNDDVREKAQEIITRFFDYQIQQNIKPPPEMWTPEEVLEQKKKQQAEIEAAKEHAEEESKTGGQTKNRRGSTYVPPQFFCPISQELMVDPVSTVDGHVYDRINIQRWFNTGKMTSPVTGQALTSTALTPNHPLRQMIEAYRPGHTHRADLDTEWSCVACTMANKPTDMMCSTCGAEKPPRVVRDPDAVPAASRILGI